MVSPCAMALFGQTGSQTSQLTQSSLILSDISTPRTPECASVTSVGLLRLDEHVIHARRRHRRLDALVVRGLADEQHTHALHLSLIHISEPTRLLSISYAVF